jgi:ATP-dependent exoDNAse (exonuclease V) beta subunit
MSDSSEATTLNLPRELVLASAGTGKTHWLSSRIIGLLEADVAVDQIVASTFTRKAAGEILLRVLERMARATLDEEEAARLSREACLDGRAAGSEEWGKLLSQALQELHRWGVSTLDSLFLRIARSYEADLGLPPAWSIVDDPTHERLRSDAIDDVIASLDPARVMELVRGLARGKATRRVHEQLLAQAAHLYRLGVQIDPEAPLPWNPIDLSTPALGTDLSGPARARVVEALEAAELPRKKDGEPHRGFEKAVAKHSQQILSGDWEGMCSGLAAKFLDGSLSYYGKPLSPSLQAALEQGLALARCGLGQELNQQAEASRALVEAYSKALQLRQRLTGQYGFEDVTRLLLARPAVGGREDLWHRLDRRIGHLLLDEFQDTSLEQWLALNPIYSRLLDEERDGSTGVVVADPKQSIYGWRGAEPELVHRVGRQFALDRRELSKSYRSSQVILDFVNRAFDRLPENPSLGDSEEDREAAAKWFRSFSRHKAAKHLPGYVRIEVGPRDPSMRKKDRPRMMEFAASRIALLARTRPAASIGVLVRHNLAVSRLITELRKLSIDVSEEGGARLTDVASVETVLALLRVADHPGHSIARYMVARSPLGPAAGLTDPFDNEEAEAVARRIRSDLVHRGYGDTIQAWFDALAAEEVLDARDGRRLAQLVEIGHRWDDRATLRPSDFVRLVESERVSDATDARLRVMTVHQAKGLEFDTVVLPELDTKLIKIDPASNESIPERDPVTGLVQKVFPPIKQAIRPLFPEAREAIRQTRAAALTDSLGFLYVALTRPRQSLHVYLAADDADTGPKPSMTYAWLLRHALDRTDELREGECVEFGDDSVDLLRPGDPSTPPAAPVSPASVDLRLLSEEDQDLTARRRLVPHSSPSAQHGRSLADLRWALSLEGTASRRAGSIVHAWLEHFEWLDDGQPGDAGLRRVAFEIFPGIATSELEHLVARFRDWLDGTAVREILYRDRYEAGARVETELPFAQRVADSVIRGSIDRLVTWGPEGSPIGAEVIDFKTDAVEAGSTEFNERVELYTPQLEAYREAVARMFALDVATVRAALVFLPADRVVEISSS